MAQSLCDQVFCLSFFLRSFIWYALNPLAIFLCIWQKYSSFKTEFTEIFDRDTGQEWMEICYTTEDKLRKAQSLYITEPQNHRMFGVGRDLRGSSSPTPLPKQGHLQQTAQDLVQAGLEYLQRRRYSHTPPTTHLTHTSWASLWGC